MQPTLTVVLAAVIGLAIAIASGAVRYDGEMQVNLPSVFIVTMLFALPGAPLLLASFIMLCVRRQSPRWRRAFLAGTAGSAVAASAVVVLAYAGDCVPHCKGARGGLTDGLLLSVPAGFTAGLCVLVLWLLVGRLER